MVKSLKPNSKVKEIKKEDTRVKVHPMAGKRVLEVSKSVMDCAIIGAKVIAEERREREEKAKQEKAEQKALEREKKTQESVKRTQFTLTGLEDECDKYVCGELYSFKTYIKMGTYIEAFLDLVKSSRITEEDKEHYKLKACKYANWVMTMWMRLQKKEYRGEFNLYFSQMEDSVRYFAEHFDEEDNEVINDTKRLMLAKGLFTVAEYCRYFFYESFKCLAVYERNFLAFLLANEWHRKFPREYDGYAPKTRTQPFIYDRYEVLLRHNIIQAIQHLIDGTTRKCVIEAPPAIGKSMIGISYILFKFGLNPNSKQLLGSADAELAKKFFNAVLEIIQSNEYDFLDIFPECKKIIVDGEGYAIYSNNKKTEPNYLFASIMKGGTGKIHPDKDGGVYCDDMVSKTEQVTPDMFSKIYSSFVQTFLDRVEDETVPFLIIGTPWGQTCPISRFIKAFSTVKKTIKINNKFITTEEPNPYFEHISVPAYYMNDSGFEVTNFDYKGNRFLSVEFFKEKIYSDPDGEFMAKSKFLMEKLDKETNPFMQYQTITLKEFNERIKSDEERIWVSATDIATQTNGDNLASGYFCYFPKTGDCVMRDIVYSNKGSDTTIPKVIRKHLQYKIEKSYFEEKEGTNKNVFNYGIGYEIQKSLIKNGLNCNVVIENACGSASKTNRISSFEQEIKGNFNIRNWRFLFLSDEDIRTMEEYREAMKDLKSYYYNTKKHDDFPDMLAICGSQCIPLQENKQVFIGKIKF